MRSIFIYFLFLFMVPFSVHGIKVGTYFVGFDWVNFHEVDKNQLYRAAQMDPKILQETIEDYGIQTVINLRGAKEHKKWYRKEVQVVEDTGVEYISIRMRAGTLPRKENLVELLDAYRSAPKPILIHCESGADRTGEAAALYQIEHMNISKKKASKKSLSMYYAHIAFLWPAKKYFVEEVYQDYRWAVEEYDPCAYSFAPSSCE